MLIPLYLLLHSFVIFIDDKTITVGQCYLKICQS